MAGGLAALLDDIAALAKLAAASTDDVAAASTRASVKAAGVVVDDAAVTPQYVQGIDPKRELPIIWRITLGSLRNKLLIILPVALLLSEVAPWLLTPILMLGGTYLCFEGAEKILELVTGHTEEKAAAEQGPEAEKRIISGAVRTDLILSAEIMVISLNEVMQETIWHRLAILVVVGIAMTVIVYGAVGLLVKMDDVGLSLTRRSSGGSQALGRGLVKAMPIVLAIISYVGMIAMLWVGGHIILKGLDEFGAHYPYAWVHHLEEWAHTLPVAPGAISWLLGTLCSAVFGLIWGAVIVAILHVLPFGKQDGHADAEGAASDGAAAEGAAPQGAAAKGAHRA